MTKWELFKYEVYNFWRYDFLEDKIFYVKRKIWNCGIKLLWYKLWIRKDEFHKSLDLDINAMLVMNREQREKYYKEIENRRHIAHERDLEREDECLK